MVWLSIGFVLVCGGLFVRKVNKKVVFNNVPLLKGQFRMRKVALEVGLNRNLIAKI